MNILEQIERRKRLVRARVREVAKGRIPALFIHGPAGHGKTDTVMEELNAVLGEGNWLHFNSFMSAAGLRDVLLENSDRLLFFEDMEPLLEDKVAAGLLRSGCGSARGRQREITYTTATGTMRFPFSGGIIIASNEDLSKHGVMGGVASRMKPFLWQLSNAEIEAIIRDAASQQDVGRNGELLPESEATELAEFVIGLMNDGHEIDLRTFFDHAVPSYLHWKHEAAIEEIQGKLRSQGIAIPGKVVHWKDIVRSKIEGQFTVESQQQRLQRERLFACECYKDGATTDERIELWANKTGLKKQAFYNRIKEAKASGLFHRICG